MRGRETGLVAVAILVLLAGCSAPLPDTGTVAEPTTAAPTQTATTPTPTTTETPVGKLDGTIAETSLDGNQVLATISLWTAGAKNQTASIALRYVENDSFAKVGTVTVAPGERQTLIVSLPIGDADPRNLTVQFRIDGQVVAERPAT